MKGLDINVNWIVDITLTQMNTRLCEVKIDYMNCS